MTYVPIPARLMDPYAEAIPERAELDETLLESDLLVLAAISHHDRSSWGGEACWATEEHLADLAWLSIRQVSDAITRLIRAGYVRRPDLEPGEWRSRGRRPLCVVFTAEDLQFFADLNRRVSERERSSAPNGDADER